MLLAQITDLHVVPKGELAYGRVDTARMFRDAVAHLNRLVPRPDAVLITGDLADKGQPEAYAHMREILATLAVPWYVIPGNHDRADALRAAFADQPCLPREGRFLQFVIDAHPLRIVALDSVVPGRVRGLLCEERLDWLEHALAQAPERPTLVMLHHAPFVTGLPHFDEVGMEGVEAFERVIERHRQVERVICGHVHRAIQVRFGNTIASSCPSTAHQVAPDLRPDGIDSFTLEPPAFQLHRWNGSRLFTYTINIGDFDGPYPFP